MTLHGSGPALVAIGIMLLAFRAHMPAGQVRGSITPAHVDAVPVDVMTIRLAALYTLR